MWRWLKRLVLLTVFGLILVLLVPVGIPTNARAIAYIGIDTGLPAFNWLVYFVQHLLLTVLWVLFQNGFAAFVMLLTGGTEGPKRQAVAVLLGMAMTVFLGTALPSTFGVALSPIFLVFAAIMAVFFMLPFVKEPHVRLVVRAGTIAVHNSGEDRVVLPLESTPVIQETNGRPVLAANGKRLSLFSVLLPQQIAWLNTAFSNYVDHRNKILEIEGHDLSEAAHPPEALTELVEGTQ